MNTTVTTEELIREHLIAGGFLDAAGWTARDDSAQPRPEVFLSWFDEEQMDRGQRGLLIRLSGDAGSDFHIAEPIITIAAISKVDRADQYYTRDYLEQIYRYLQRNFEYECLFGMNTDTVRGPMLTQSGRMAFELTVSAQRDTGVDSSPV